MVFWFTKNKLCKLQVKWLVFFREADILRRAIGKKNSETIAAQKKKFIARRRFKKDTNKKMPRRSTTTLKSLPTMDLINHTQ